MLQQREHKMRGDDYGAGAALLAGDGDRHMLCFRKDLALGLTKLADGH